MSAVRLPVHEQGHPIGRRVVADHLDQGGRERVRDGRRGAEHGGLPPARAVTGGHHRQDDERAGAAPDHDPAQVGRHLLPAARVGEEEETGEPHGDGAGADPLADGDGEAEIGPEDEDEEQQFHGQDRLHHGEPPVVQREGLQQEGADHEAETQQPHPSTDGVRHQAQAHGGLLRGVFDAHALEHAGQRVRQGRCYGKDIDHRLADQFNGRMSPITQEGLSWHPGSVWRVLWRHRAGIVCKRALRTGSGPSPARSRINSRGHAPNECGNWVTFTNIFRQPQWDLRMKEERSAVTGATDK